MPLKLHPHLQPRHIRAQLALQTQVICRPIVTHYWTLAITGRVVVHQYSRRAIHQTWCHPYYIHPFILLRQRFSTCWPIGPTIATTFWAIITSMPTIIHQIIRALNQIISVIVMKRFLFGDPIDWTTDDWPKHLLITFIKYFIFLKHLLFNFWWILLYFN